MTRFHKTALAAIFTLLLFCGLSVSSANAETNVDDGEGPLIVIGVGGLLWQDISPDATPALFDLVDESDLSSLSVRTQGEITCPADGWLTLATGRRTLAEVRGTDPVCSYPSALEVNDDSARVNIFEIASLNKQYGWRPDIGAFGSDLATAGIDVAAIGTGAALAAANSGGNVATYSPTISEYLDSALASKTPGLLLVDAGNIAHPGFTEVTSAPGSQAPSTIDTPTRADQLASIDAQIGELLNELSTTAPDARILLFGPGGTSTTAHLTVLSLAGPETGDGWLRADSTRRDSVLTLTDLNPTVRKLLDIDQASDAVGAPAYSTGERGQTADAVNKLATDDAASHVIRDSLAPLMITLGALNLAGLAGAILLRRTRPKSKLPRTIWRFFTALAIAPLATFIGAALPWTDLPGFSHASGLFAAILASWIVLSTIVLLGPWRRHPLGPIAAAGLITALTLLIDSATGSHLQWISPLGDTPLVAGRFYGISNPPFTLAYTGALVGLAIVCAPLLRRFSPRVATTLMITFGAAFTVLVASPSAGANVGGTIAAVPGFIVLALLVSQVKITRSGIGFMIFGGIFVFTVFALIDFAQPPEQRAHLGRFIARAGQGELLPMLWRKVEASFTIVSGNVALTLIALAITGLLATMIAFPKYWRITAVDELYEEFPLLRAGVISALIGISIAVFTNDSGVALAFITLMILAPMLAAATVRYWFELKPAIGTAGDPSTKAHGAAAGR